MTWPHSMNLSPSCRSSSNPPSTRAFNDSECCHGFVPGTTLRVRQHTIKTYICPSDATIIGGYTVPWATDWGNDLLPELLLFGSLRQTQTVNTYQGGVRSTPSGTSRTAPSNTVAFAEQHGLMNNATVPNSSIPFPCPTRGRSGRSGQLRPLRLVHGSVVCYQNANELPQFATKSADTVWYRPSTRTSRW